MTLSINLVSARVQQQFIAVVNMLHGDGEVLKGNGDVFMEKKKCLRAISPSADGLDLTMKGTLNVMFDYCFIPLGT